MAKKSRTAARPTAATSKHQKTVTARVGASLPGPYQLTKQTLAFLTAHKNIFGRVFGAAWLVMLLAVGLTQQAEYADLSAATREAVSVIPSQAERALAAVAILLSSMVAGASTSALSDLQQFYRFGLLFFLWLVTVWLVRHVQSGAAVSMRDGLYNAGAPFVSTLLVAMVGILQLIPLALVASLFAAILATGAVNYLLVTTLMIAVLLALSVATLYWLTATVFALLIVTIPGTYPLAAHKSAKGIVRGFRLPLLGRMAWVLVGAVFLVALGILPLILLDAVAGLSLSFLTVALFEALVIAAVMTSATYLYILYRSVIDVRAD